MKKKKTQNKPAKNSQGNKGAAIKVGSSQWFKSVNKKWELYGHLAVCSVPKSISTYRLENATICSAYGYDSNMFYGYPEELLSGLSTSVKILLFENSVAGQQWSCSGEFMFHVAGLISASPVKAYVSLNWYEIRKHGSLVTGHFCICQQDFAT